MIDVERVDYIRVPVTDIEKAKHFYGGLLGLPQNPNSPADDWVEYEAGNVTLAVMTPQSHEYEFSPLPPGTLALRVRDVAEAKGVEFLGETYDSSVCLMGFFKDPDGNVVILHRRYAPRVPR